MCDELYYMHKIECIHELLDLIQKDIKNATRFKKASQRVRVNSVKLAKYMKEFRKLSNAYDREKPHNPNVECRFDGN